MGAFTNGVYVPTIGETGWGTNVNDFLTRSGEEYVNVKQLPYAAVGDGVADDTAEIQAAIDAVGGGTVYFPPGIYKVSTLIPKSNSVWKGAGARSWDYTTGGTVIRYTDTSGPAISLSAVSNVRFMDFQLNCTSDTAGVVGFKFTDPSNNCHMTNVVLAGPGTANAVAIQMTGQTSCNCHNRFDTLYLRNWKEGVRLSGFANANVFSNIASATLTTGIVIGKIGADTQGGQDNLFQRVEMDGGTPTGITIGDNGDRNVFIKCVMDGVSTTGVTIAASVDGTMFLGCIISPTLTDGAPGTVYLGTVAPGVTAHLQLGDTNLYQENNNILATDDKLHVLSELELDGALNHDGSTVGFYGTAPVAKQTGVAVTAAGVHAALVNLGLIT